ERFLKPLPPLFPIQTGRHKAPQTLKNYQTHPPTSPADVVLGGQIQFPPAKQIHHRRPRSTQTSDRLVALCLSSILPRPIHDAPVEIVATMADVPDKTGHEMTVGARHRFSALDRACRYQKPASKSLYQVDTRYLDQEITRLLWSDRRQQPSMLACSRIDSRGCSYFNNRLEVVMLRSNHLSISPD